MNRPSVARRRRGRPGRSRCRPGLALLAGACIVAPASGAETVAGRFNGYVTVTSDYRQHGLSHSRGEPSLQLGADLQHPGGWFAGGWVATTEYAQGGAEEPSRRTRLGYYLGYSHRTGRWSLAATAGRYAYPKSRFDYDYTELGASVGYRDRIFLTASYADHLFGRDRPALNVELGGVLPLPFGIELGATLGRLDLRHGARSFTHWNVGASKTLAARLAVDARYYDGDAHYWSPIATSTGGRWVLSASYGFGGER